MNALNPRPFPKRVICSICHATNRTLRRLQVSWSSAFTTTAHPFARERGRPKIDQRITLIRYYLTHPLNPPPLRFSRLRALRHWTIHRAAQLYFHKRRKQDEMELERHYNSMREAMEELRIGAGDGGTLYRRAVQRRGIFGGLQTEQSRGVIGNGGIPLEYARGQVDGPSRGGWDDGWVRG